MQRIFLLLILSIFLVQCKSPEPKAKNNSATVIERNDKDTFQVLCQFWQLLDAENPTFRDISYSNGGITLESGIVFMTDSTVLENPAGDRNYGKFTMENKRMKVNYGKGRTVVYDIEKISPDSLVLKRNENNRSSDLSYKGTHTFWKNAKKNPFAPENYSWAEKPKKPEDLQQIKDRAKECVQFYSYYFQGFVDGGAQKINFEGLPCCFNWYQGGIFIQSEKTLDKKWKSCFYSEEQALTARQMLQDALSKKYDWDSTEANWLQQTADVLQQIHDGM